MNDKDFTEIKRFLDTKIREFRVESFKDDDPICVPHQYSKLQDIEITAFFSSLFAWGRRTTIINKAESLFRLMDNAPYQFVTQYEEKDLKRFRDFVHRTFNALDLYYFLDFFRRFYQNHLSLEEVFLEGIKKEDQTVADGINGFYRKIFNDDTPVRTRRHISAPFRKSACKRTNMFLRWMVRKDSSRIDFGLWTKIRTDQLIIPLDVHVYRVSVRLGLLKGERNINWDTAVALTEKLKEFDPSDPVKYDFALYGLGSLEKFR